MNILFLTRYTEYSSVFRTTFDEENYSCNFVHSFDSLVTFISRQSVEIIFIDYYLPRTIQIGEFLHQFFEAEEIIIPVLFYNTPLPDKSMRRSEVLTQEMTNKYNKTYYSFFPVFLLIEKSLAKISFYHYLNTMYLQLVNSDKESDRILFLLNKNRNTPIEISQLTDYLLTQENLVQESFIQEDRKIKTSFANKKAVVLQKKVYSCIRELRHKYEVNESSPELIVSPAKDCYMLNFPI